MELWECVCKITAEEELSFEYTLGSTIIGNSPVNKILLYTNTILNTVNKKSAFKFNDKSHQLKYFNLKWCRIEFKEKHTKQHNASVQQGK